MKKLNLLFVALVLTITSCSKEDTSSTVSENSIVGTWKMVDYNYYGTTETTAQGQTLTADFVGEAFNMNNSITFQENPNVILSNGSFSLRVTSTVSGQTSTQELHGLEAVDGSSWEIINGELITDTDSQFSKMKIEELTDTSLVLLGNQKLDLSQSGASISTDINVKVYLEKE